LVKGETLLPSLCLPLAFVLFKDCVLHEWFLPTATAFIITAAYCTTSLNLYYQTSPPALILLYIPARVNITRK
jgi:hypothetical protein